MAQTAAEKAAVAALNPAPAEGEPDHTEDKGKFVRFTSHNGIRSISKEEWESIGVKGQEAASFDRTNAWRLPVSDFNEKALNYLLNVDGEFTKED